MVTRRLNTFTSRTRGGLGTFKFAHDKSSGIQTFMNKRLKDKTITVPQKILIALSTIYFFFQSFGRKQNLVL